MIQRPGLKKTAGALGELIDKTKGDDSPVKVRLEKSGSEGSNFQRQIMVKRQTFNQNEILKNSICGIPRKDFFESKAPGLFLS